jgi:hypothetical protein
MFKCAQLPDMPMGLYVVISSISHDNIHLPKVKKPYRSIKLKKAWFTEAGKEFVDFIFSLLILPIGAVGIFIFFLLFFYFSNFCSIL